MLRMTILTPLIGGALLLSACAESIHQVQRDTELLGVPLGLEQEVDTRIRFADLKRAPSDYIGQTVMIGGNVIKAKRSEAGTELEVLQLPTAKDGEITGERLLSEGRFLAVREQFLDPASLPQGTPITVIGTVKGETTRSLDESDYTYPILEIKHIIDWNSVAAKRGRDRSPYYGMYYPPYGYTGFSPYGRFGGPFGAYGPYGGYYGGRGFWGPSHGFSPGPSAPPPPASVSPRLRSR